MNFADILICADGSEAGRARTEAAFQLAERSGARVIGYYLPSPTELPKDDEMSLRPADEAPVSEGIDAASAEFDRLLGEHGVEGSWILGDKARAVHDLLDYVRCCDLAVIGLGDPDNPGSDPQGIDVERFVVSCGRPVLGLPIINLPEKIGHNIMVAWDGSREAARALHDALPFLRDAATIRVASLDIDPLSMKAPGIVVEHLTRMGITATVDTTLSLDLPIGEELLSRVDWEKVDLLVAGAFGHSRTWEHLFGGPSMTLIHQMMVPVLISH